MAVEPEADEALIARYARGEAAAFDALYRRHEMRIWRYLLRNMSDRPLAEELMQEVWLAVARDAGRYRPTAPFITWLFTIARNRLIDARRRQRRHLSLEALAEEGAALPEALVTAPAAGPLSAALVADEAGALMRALGELPHEQRDAFLLQAEGELSVEEVAVVTGSSFETTKSRLRYARSKLRALLEAYA